MKGNKNRNSIINSNHDLIQLLGLDYLDKTDDKQPDTTDMPDLESEESAEQRRNQEGQGLKILVNA